MANPSPATRFRPGWRGGPGALKGVKKKPLTRRLIKALEDTFVSRVDKHGKVHRIELPDGMTVADLIVLRTIRMALRGDTSARRDIKECVEGKTPEPRPEIYEDDFNEDAEALAQPERFPDEDERPPGLGQGPTWESPEGRPWRNGSKRSES
jgi:hypothetical protein